MSATDQLRTAPGVGLYQGQSTQTFNLLPTGTPALRDPRLRRALSLAIDREALAQTVFDGTAEPLKTALLLPIDTFWGRAEFTRALAELPDLDADLDAARALVQEAGAPSQPIKLGVQAGDAASLQIANAIVDAGRKIGLPIETKQFQPAQFVALFFDPEARKAIDVMETTNYADIPDPLEFFELSVIPGSVQNMGYDNPVVTRAIEAARGEQDESRRAQYVVDAVTATLDDLPVIPLLYLHERLALSKRLGGAPARFPPSTTRGRRRSERRASEPSGLRTAGHGALCRAPSARCRGHAADLDLRDLLGARPRARQPAESAHRRPRGHARDGAGADRAVPPRRPLPRPLRRLARRRRDRRLRQLVRRQGAAGRLADRRPAADDAVAAGLRGVADRGDRVGLGTFAALRGRRTQAAVAGVTAVGMGVPSFVAASVLISYFAVQLGWFPVFGPGSGFTDRIWHLTLPAIALALASLAYVAQVSRAAVATELRRDHVTTAVARGFPRGQVVRRHALRNAAIPIATVSGVTIAYLITGTAIVEQAFQLNGLGSLLIQSVTTNDLPTVQGVCLVVVLAFLLVNVIVDALYGLLDPRVGKR